MADDSEVSVQFGAQTGGFDAGVEEVKDKLGEVGEAAGPLGGIFDDLAGKLAAAFATDRIIDFARSSREAAVALDIMSERTGVAASTLSALNIPLLQSGSSVEDLSTSMRFLERNVADGSSKTVEALDDLGLSLTKLRSMSPQEQLEAVVRALAENANKITFMADGIDLLGKSFQNQAPFIKQFGANLHEVINTAKTDGDALSDAVISEIHRQDDEWINLYEHVKMYVAEMSLGALKVAELNDQPHPSTVPTPGYLSDADAAAAFSKALNGPNPAAGNNNDIPNAANAQAAQAAAAQEIQIETDKINTELAIDKLGLEEQKANDAAAVDAHKMSKQQEMEDLQAFATMEYQLEQEALDKELALNDEGSVQYQQILDKKEILTAQFNAKMAELAQQAAKAQQQADAQILLPFKSLTSTMGSDFQQVMNGILQGTQTWQQAEAKLFDNLAIAFIDAVAKMIAEWAAFKAVTATFGAGAASALGLSAGPIGGLLGGSSGGGTATTTALTTAITGNTAATASNSTGILSQIQSGLQWIAQTLGLTTATAAQATASTASTAATTASTTATTGLIPTILANTAAITANTTALFASKAIPSFDTGSWNLPGNTLAMVHQGEMIIPAQQAGEIRAGTASIGGSSYGGGGVGVTMNVSAIDAKSFMNLMNSPQIMSSVAKNLGAYMAANPSVRGNY